MKPRMILIRPLFTEKMTMQQEALNKYAFQVEAHANKIEIKKAVEQKFDVKVKSVRTFNVRGKKRFQLTRAGRFEGRRPDWKKAIVTLQPDQSIELFDNA